MSKASFAGLVLAILGLIGVVIAIASLSSAGSDGSTEAVATEDPADADPEDADGDVAAPTPTPTPTPFETPFADFDGGGTVETFVLEQEEAGHVYTREEAVTAAEQFDLISALRGSYPEHVDAMREANPDLTTVVYLNAAFAQINESNDFPEEWYLVDASGERVTNDFGLWMMDVGNPDWWDERVDRCLAFLDESGYDGCFLDNLGSGTLFPPSLSAQPIDPRTGEEFTDADWVAGTTELSRRIHEELGDRPVVGNGLVSGLKYFDDAGPTSALLDVSDIGLAETFVRPSGLAPDEYRPESSWLLDVEMLRDAAERGDRIMAVTKIWRDDATEEDVARWHEFALASFLLGDDGSHYFSFSGARDESGLIPDAHADTDIGVPTTEFFRTADGVHRRVFEDGLVLANSSDDTVTVELEETFVNLAGDEVTSVELIPASGAVLRTP